MVGLTARKGVVRRREETAGAYVPISFSSSRVEHLRHEPLTRDTTHEVTVGILLALSHALGQH